jgi:putative heme-binding domain-containing protein
MAPRSWVRPLVLILAIVAPPAILALCSTAFFPLTTTTVQTKLGETLFGDRCVDCHREADDGPARMGPTLANFALTAATRRPGMSVEEYLIESIVDPGAFQPPGSRGRMPQFVARDLTDDDVRNLVAFLLDDGDGPDYRRLASVPIVRPPATDSGKVAALSSLENGFRIFREKVKCETCHPIRRYDGFDLIAPNLLQSGARSEEYLRESILDPDAAISAGYAYHTLLTKSGRVLTGRVLREDSERVLAITGLVDALELVELPVEEIVSSKPSKVSTMPSYRDKLTPAEVQDLVAFLRALVSP